MFETCVFVIKFLDHQSKVGKKYTLVAFRYHISRFYFNLEHSDSQKFYWRNLPSNHKLKTEIEKEMQTTEMFFETFSSQNRIP